MRGAEQGGPEIQEGIQAIVGLQTPTGQEGDMSIAQCSGGIK